MNPTPYFDVNGKPLDGSVVLKPGSVVYVKTQDKLAPKLMAMRVVSLSPRRLVPAPDAPKATNG